MSIFKMNIISLTLSLVSLAPLNANEETIVFEKIFFNEGFTDNETNRAFLDEMEVPYDKDLIGTIPLHVFSGVTFRNIRFNECELIKAYFQDCSFEDVWIENCNFFGTKFLDCSFVNTHFHNSNLKDESFSHCQMTQVDFSNNIDLSYVAFNNSKLAHVHFVDCMLKGTSFLEATIHDCQIFQSDLTDTLFLEMQGEFQTDACTPHAMTGSIIGILWDFEHPGTYTKAAFESVKLYGGIPLRYDRKFDGMDRAVLELEVEQALYHPLPSGSISIPDAILKNAPPGSMIERIKLRNQRLVTLFHALLMTGGFDINPKFYGEELDPRAEIDAYHLRSMTEFSMFFEAEKKKLPILAICRGNQLVHIAKGGSLNQHVEGHDETMHELVLKTDAHPKAAAVIAGIIGETTQGFSDHHQAVKILGKGFEVVIEHEGVPEACVSLDGRIILLQFHPEIFYLTRLKAMEENGGVEPEIYPFADGKNFFLDLLTRAGRYHPIPVYSKR